jgi:hypothetical protein
MTRSKELDKKRNIHIPILSYKSCKDKYTPIIKENNKWWLKGSKDDCSIDNYNWENIDILMIHNNILICYNIIVCIGRSTTIKSVDITLYDIRFALSPYFIYFLKPEKSRKLTTSCDVSQPPRLHSRVLLNRFFIINYFALAIWHFLPYIYTLLPRDCRPSLVSMCIHDDKDPGWRSGENGAGNCQIWITFNGRELKSFAPTRNSRDQFNGA